MLKLAIKLSQFDVSYKLCITIKGQDLVDFIVKFTYTDASEVAKVLAKEDSQSADRHMRTKRHNFLESYL